MKDQANKSGWSPCGGGEVAGLVDNLTAQRRTRTVWRAASAVVATAVVVMAVFMVSKSLLRNENFNFGEISCSDVIGALPQYVAGEVSADLANRIRQHLKKCPHCGPKHDQMKGRQTTTSLAAQAVAMFQRP